MRDVRRLSVDIGPRLATGPGYRRAADLVARRFAELGYDVSRQRVRVPAGDSWGTPVAAGRSANVIAEPPGFDREQPHLLVGAHLDTVAVAPGAGGDPIVGCVKPRPDDHALAREPLRDPGGRASNMLHQHVPALKTMLPLGPS